MTQQDSASDTKHLYRLSGGATDAPLQLKTAGLLTRDCEAGPALTKLSACMIRGDIATVRRMGNSFSVQVSADCVEVLK